MSIGYLLQAEIERCAERLSEHSLMRRARAGRVSPTTVALYLSSIHYLVQHTPLHLARALRVTQSRGQLVLARYFEHKLSEEAGHDQWAESDLSHLQDRFALSSRGSVCPSMRRLVEFVQTRIDERPASYVVYILFAEYLTVLVGPAWAGALERHCGVPADALTVVTRHALLDRDHVASAVAELDQLLAGVEEAPLFDMLAQSIHHFEAFCDELAAELAPVAA